MKVFIDRKAYHEVRFELKPTQTFSARDSDLPQEVIDFIHENQRIAGVINEYLEVLYDVPPKLKAAGMYPAVPDEIKGALTNAKTEVPKEANKGASGSSKRGVRKQVRTGGSNKATGTGDKV